MAGRLIADQQAVWAGLSVELREAGICVLEPDELNAAERTWLDGHFRDQISPVLTPLAIDPAHPFPFIPNLGFTIALTLTRRRDGKTMNALLPVPSQLQRFIRLPASDRAIRFLPLESLIEMNLERS